MTIQLAQTLPYSLILLTLDYCNAVPHGIPSGNIQKPSVFRTVQHGSFSRRQGDLTPSYYYASCTGCRFNIESRTSWWYRGTDLRGPQRIDASVSESSHDSGHDHSIV